VSTIRRQEAAKKTRGIEALYCMDTKYAPSGSPPRPDLRQDIPLFELSILDYAPSPTLGHSHLLMHAILAKKTDIHSHM